MSLTGPFYYAIASVSVLPKQWQYHCSTYSIQIVMQIEAQKVRYELAKIGIVVNNIYDLVNSNNRYPAAIPVLLELLQEGIQSLGIKEGIIRALAVKEAKGRTGSVLITEYNRLPKDEMLVRWAIGNTLYRTIVEDNVESILPIVLDNTNGMSRQMFVAALGKVKSDQAENALIQLLDDEEVTPHALEALRRMKSRKGRDKIAMLINHRKAVIRKEAQKALTKIS